MSCFAIENPLIYIIEIFINKLTFMEDKMKEFDDHPINVKIKLLDLPSIEISREDFDSIKPTPIDENGTVNFSVGKSCLFIKKPNDFVRELQLGKVKIDVCRVGDKYPTMESEISFPGCFCDQSITSNPPFLISGDFPLKNIGNDLSGFLNLSLKLTCLGNLLSTCYEKHKEFSLFKNDNQESELAIKELTSSSESVINNGTEMLKQLRDELEQGKGTPVTEVKDKNKKVKKGKKKKPK